MTSLAIVNAAIALLEVQQVCSPYPGSKELLVEMYLLRKRVQQRLHRKEHGDCTSEVIEYRGIELAVDYTYTPAIPAPPCSNPSDPAYGVPPESEEINTHHVWSHDDVSELLTAQELAEIEAQLCKRERKNRGIL